MVWPFHLFHEFSEIFPFKTHYRTLSGRQLRIDININASWGWAGCGKCDVSWRRFVDTGNSISRKIFLTGAAKPTVIICTVSILMTIVIASCAFIYICTFIIKHREACLADTLTIRTRRTSWATNFTRVLFTTDKSISKEIISTNANFVIVTVSIRIALQARVLNIRREIIMKYSINLFDYIILYLYKDTFFHRLHILNCIHICNGKLGQLSKTRWCRSHDWDKDSLGNTSHRYPRNPGYSDIRKLLGRTCRFVVFWTRQMNMWLFRKDQYLEHKYIRCPIKWS